MNEEVLIAIEEGLGFKNTTKILLAYTIIKLRYKFWKSGRSSGPSGEEPIDFVCSVIQNSLDKKIGWSWNKQKYKNVIDFLKSRIDTAIANAIRSKENKSNSNGEITSPEVINKLTTTQVHESDNELYQHLLSIIKEKSDSNSDPKLIDVFDAVVAEYKNNEIESLCDLTSAEVNNYKKKIKRALIAYKSYQHA